jgi:alanyl-tRNA synthetase
MGFERVTGIMQNTNGFKDFTKTISNYETDIFRPLFDKLEKLSGKKYGSTLPASGSGRQTEQEKIDIAFRVIADHIRTLSFSIADGILPGNTDRNYVLRRILRRAVRYGRTLEFHEPFFYKLVEVLAETMGDVFPEIRKKQSHIQEVIKAEEEAFNKTLDRGIELFNAHSSATGHVRSVFTVSFPYDGNRGVRAPEISFHRGKVKHFDEKAGALLKTVGHLSEQEVETLRSQPEGVERALLNVRDDPAMKEKALQFLAVFPASIAFELYDTYGFPLDLTELMARERGLAVDVEGFNKLMDEQRARARAAQKKEIISASHIDTSRPTRFVGFDQLRAEATVLDIVNVKEKIAVTFDVSPLYAEMGGQVGDTGEVQAGAKIWHIAGTQKIGGTFLHFLADADAPDPGGAVELRVDARRRGAIQRHHTVTHLLHWALHEVVSPDATQKGSYVGPDKLTFDFTSAALSPAQLSDVERLVNERILENAGVTWIEVPFAEVKGRKDVMQFFGEKYGDLVRVVQIGGQARALDGYSMELCGGTHTRAAGEIGLFRILSEGAVAAGIRRIEAAAGLRAYEKMKEDTALISSVAARINAPASDLEKKLETLLAQQKTLEKQLHAARQKEAAQTAGALVAKARAAASRAIIENLGAVDGDFLQAVADALKGQFKGVAVLAGSANNAVSLIATVSPELTGAWQAGKIIQTIAPIVGGRGGGKPDNARGGGKDVTKIGEALDKARQLAGESGG